MNPAATTLGFGLVHSLITPIVAKRYGRRGLVVLSAIATLALGTIYQLPQRVGLTFGIPLAMLGPLATTFVIWRLSRRSTPPPYLHQAGLGLAAFVGGTLAAVLLLWLVFMLVFGSYRG